MDQQNIYGIKYEVDIDDLKTSTAEASKKIKMANAEFNESSSKLDNWATSVDGVSAKIKQLDTILQAEKSKLAQTQKSYNDTVDSIKSYQKEIDELKDKKKEAIKIYGSESEEVKQLSIEITKLERTQLTASNSADKLKISIANKQATVNKTEKSIKSYELQLNQVKEAQKRAEISGNSLEEELKNIKNTSDDTVQATKKMGDGFTVMKGAIASLVADGFKSLISNIKEMAIETDKAYNTFETKTGTSKEEMSKFNKVMNELYSENYGESITDIANAMSEVKQQTKETDPQNIKELTKYAILLRDTFDFDIRESMRAVNMLIEQFGLNGEQAFNLIVQGAQKGLDKNADLLDTINEYAVHYKQLGYTSEDFFNALVNGSTSGTFSIDKLADAVKEFGIRTKDTANTTTEGFELINLNADEMRAKFAQGGEVAKKATEETITALFSLNDEVKRNQAGVDLFGTMWEDLGEDAIKSLMGVNGNISLTNDALKKVDSTKYADLGNDIQQTGRYLKTSLIEPISKEFMPVANDILKKIVPPLKESLSFFIKNFKTIGSVTLGVATAYKVSNTSLKTLNTVTKLSNTLSKLKTANTIAETTATNGATVATKALAVAQKLTPWGMVAGLIAGVVVGLTAYIASSNNAKDSTDKNTIATDKLIEKQKQLNDTLKENKSTREEIITSAEAEGATADILFKKIDELNGVQEKSNAQKETMKTLVEKLNEIMPELNIQYDAEKDSLNMSTDAIKANIEAQKDLILAKASQENMLEIAKDIADVEVQNANAVAQHVVNEDALKKAVNKTEEAKREYQKTGNNIHSQEFKNYSIALNSEIKKREAFNKTKETIEKNEKELIKLNKEYEKTSNYAESKINSAEIEKQLNILVEKARLQGIEIPKKISEGIKEGKYAVPQSIEEMNALIEFQSLRDRAKNAGVGLPKSISDGIKSGELLPSDAVTKMNSLVSFSDLLLNSELAGQKVPNILKEQIINGQLVPQQAIEIMQSWVNFNDMLKKAGLAGTAIPNDIKKSILEGKMSPAEAIAEMNRLVNEELDKQPVKSKEKGNESANAYTSGISDKKASAKVAGEVLASSAKKGIDSGDWTTSGKNAGNGFINGMLNVGVLNGVMLAGATLANRALAGLRNAGGEHSPWKTTQQSGKYAVEGFALAINKNKAKAVDAMKNMVSEVIEKSDQLKTSLALNDIKAEMNLTASKLAQSEKLALAGASESVNNITFQQYNTSPKSLDSLEMFKNEKKLLKQFEAWRGGK